MNERDAGQATIEAALALPVVLIALLLIVQVGIVVRDAIALVQAAREGARAASVTGSDEDMRRAVARSAGPLEPDRISVEVSPDQDGRTKGDWLTVSLAYVERLAIPIVSRIVSLELPLHASATTRAERSPPTPSPTP